ncbi:MAG: hypothetical protein IKP73_15835 [Bacteroidales bacterium]|nr:hypothetical protein [Bacteroidales bacterium]
MILSDIDVNFDFTSDTPKFWDHFWDGDGLGRGGADPDAKSKTMQNYHRLIYSRVLPNGEKMELKNDSTCLYWNNIWFGNDSITATFRHVDYRPMLDKVAESMDNYRGFVENYLRKLYTIGGEIIFPAHRYSINQARGMHRKISDRFDLTLECIRRYYKNEPNPLEKCLNKDKVFFAKFNDFKGYVEFFFLQDLVSENYDNVLFWLENDNFTQKTLPQSVEEYLQFVNAELEFVAKRNQRIDKFCKGIAD